jgi:hypothetical protein
MASKVYTVEEIRENLKTKNAWLERGILAIYERQTADERSSAITKYNNGIGFNGRDAGFLSSLAKQILTWQATDPRDRRYRQPLSDRQFDSARRAMLKYAGQLASIAAANSTVKAEPVGASDRVVVLELQKSANAKVAEFDPEEFDPAMIAEAEAEARAEREAIQAESCYSVDEGDTLGW